MVNLRRGRQRLRPTLAAGALGAAFPEPPMQRVGLVSLLVLALSGCGGGSTTIRANAQSCGQELSDLKSAFDQGAVTEAEYRRLREATIRRCQKSR